MFAKQKKKIEQAVFKTVQLDTEQKGCKNIFVKQLFHSVLKSELKKY